MRELNAIMEHSFDCLPNPLLDLVFLLHPVSVHHNQFTNTSDD